tara:strand:+ start:284 stop:478 length:195 start_codon:yes stop_codon:yes gene_type:complete
MSTTETKMRKVTIDYSADNLGVRELNVEVLLHQHELDGSQLIVLKTDPRDSVKQFMRSELVSEK